MRVNLTHKNSFTQNIDKEVFEKFLWGRGIGAKIYFEEIPPEIKPLDEENKLIFMTGPLTGTIVSSSTKFQCATKSPETGIYLCSNS